MTKSDGNGIAELAEDNLPSTFQMTLWSAQRASLTEKTQPGLIARRLGTTAAGRSNLGQKAISQPRPTQPAQGGWASARSRFLLTKHLASQQIFDSY
jgi:hypothetical protein